MERQRNEFVSTASHEMRTPVAAIEGYISLAMNPNVATIDDRANNFLTKAHDTIQHLGDLFRDLLSVTKAEEGKLGGTQVPVNLTELLRGAVDDMQFTATKKNLTLVYQGAGNPGERTLNPNFWVMAIPERLREVIMNLIDNAIKFTPEGGVTITMEGNDHEVTVGVSDSGIGIATEDIPHLFQKFYRIDNSATRTIGGTGLGLYLCRTVIELFNGRIWVTSEVGKGATFHFSLPRLDTAKAEKQAAELQAAATAAAPAPTATPGTTPTAPTVVPTGAITAPAAPVAVAVPQVVALTPMADAPSSTPVVGATVQPGTPAP
jgi:two-component system sensor histidine kinase VicK